VDEVTELYLVAVAGAIALAEIYHQEWPVDNALKTMQKLIVK